MRWNELGKFLIVVLAIVGGFVMYIRPLASSVKQGLDLQGGTHVVLQAVDTPQLKVNDDALDRATHIIERRVNALGLTEPVEPISQEALELMLVPGAGFSETGGRMGRGAGFYDRFLEETKGFRLGVTCDKLLWETIPMETHDQTMDALVTETKWIRCAGA